MGVRSNDVDVHIGTLSIEGMGRATDHAATAAAVERSLVRLLGERPLPDRLTRSDRVASLDGGEIDVAQDAVGHSLGASIASAVYRSLQARS